MYNAYVTRIKNLRKHSNADRLLCGECFGNTVIVSLDYVDDQLGIYFPTDGQLSADYAEKNNLLRKKDDAGNQIGGYMDPIKRNVTAIRLRGEKSDGLFMPLASLASFGDISTLKEGDIVSTFNGVEIACKYIPRNVRTPGAPGSGNRTRKKKAPIAPLFAEHADTEQLAYNLSAFREGDIVEITLKIHGTSQRTGYLPVLKGYKRTLLEKIFRKDGTPIYEYGYVSGTRRTVLENFDGGFYGSNSFRERHSKQFEGKLMKGETVYYEVAGFTDGGAPIMHIGNNKKLNDKEFVKQYGAETVFSYGCSPDGATSIDCELTPRSDTYVYRMTMTNEDGFVVEYTPDFVRFRCEQMGVKCVPKFADVFIRKDAVISHNSDGTFLGGNLPEGMSYGDGVRDIVEKFYDGADPIGKTHVREGVAIRIVNRPKFTTFKHKNFSFKVLEGIIKDAATAPDMEEAQDVSEEM